MVSPRKLLKKLFASSSAPIWMQPRRSWLLQTPISPLRGLSIQRPLSSFSKFLLAIGQQSSFTEELGLKSSILNNSTTPHYSWTKPRTKVWVENAKWRNSRLSGWGIPSLLCHSHTARICEKCGGGLYCGYVYFFFGSKHGFFIIFTSQVCIQYLFSHLVILRHHRINHTCTYSVHS